MFLSLNTFSVGVRRVISVYSVMFFSTLRFLSDDSVNKMPCYMRDDEDNHDHRSAPGNRGGPAATGGWGGVPLIEMRCEGNSLPLMDQRDPLCPDGVCSPPSLAVLRCLMLGLGSLCP